QHESFHVNILSAGSVKSCKWTTAGGGAGAPLSFQPNPSGLNHFHFGVGRLKRSPARRRAGVTDRPGVAAAPARVNTRSGLPVTVTRSRPGWSPKSANSMFARSVSHAAGAQPAAG